MNVFGTTVYQGYVYILFDYKELFHIGVIYICSSQKGWIADRENFEKVKSCEPDRYQNQFKSRL